MKTETYRFSLRTVDWRKLLVHAGLFTLGALITYILTFLRGQNFGEYTPIIVAVITMLLEVVQKYFSKY